MTTFQNFAILEIERKERSRAQQKFSSINCCTPEKRVLFFKKNKMKNQRLRELRDKHIITTTEFMIFQNFYFGNWNEFLRFIKIPKKRLRQFWVSGMNKILKYKQYEIQKEI